MDLKCHGENTSSVSVPTGDARACAHAFFLPLLVMQQGGVEAGRPPLQRLVGRRVAKDDEGEGLHALGHAEHAPDVPGPLCECVTTVGG